MYDPDADMKHGAEQQELLQNIDSALYRAADDNDMDADALYKEAAMCLLQLLSGKLMRREEWKLDYVELVTKPIEAFTEDSEERKVLHYRVFLKMANGVGFAINHAYNANHLVPTTIS